MADSSSSEDEEELKRLQAVSVTGQDIAAAAVIPSRKKVGLCIACMTVHGLILHLASPLGADILSWCYCSGSGEQMMIQMAAQMAQELLRTRWVVLHASLHFVCTTPSSVASTPVC